MLGLVCKDETCEDNVYRHYLLHLYCPRDFVRVALPSYTRVIDDDDDEVKRAAHDLNGDSRYHKVCYSLKPMHEGNKTLCYDCYACEQSYLREKRMRKWRLSDHLLLMTLLVILTNLVVFVSDSLEVRKVTLKGALQTDGTPV